ncbi:unnamed protein product, partial [Anisakis simplex]|uniref:GIT1 n=1 Tax=Anisakis simplex TaxID=6269 RepID=A0A0M3J1B5_ANISI
IQGWGSPRKNTTASKESSGYGSGSSESDPEFDQLLHTLREGVSTENGRLSRQLNEIQSKIRSRNAGLEKSRRRSVPAYLREAFPKIFLQVAPSDLLYAQSKISLGLD